MNMKKYLLTLSLLLLVACALTSCNDYGVGMDDLNADQFDHGPLGFIGGASAVVGREVLFFGALARHPDAERIARFLAACGYTPVSLSDQPLTDFGGCVMAGGGLPHEKS